MNPSPGCNLCLRVCLNAPAINAKGFPLRAWGRSVAKLGLGANAGGIRSHRLHSLECANIERCTLRSSDASPVPSIRGWKESSAVEARRVQQQMVIRGRDEFWICTDAINVVAQTLPCGKSVHPFSIPFSHTPSELQIIVVKGMRKRAEVERPLKAIEDVVLDLKIRRGTTQIILKQRRSLAIGNLGHEGVIVNLVEASARGIVAQRDERFKEVWRLFSRNLRREKIVVHLHAFRCATQIDQCRHRARAAGNLSEITREGVVIDLESVNIPIKGRGIVWRAIVLNAIPMHVPGQLGMEVMQAVIVNLHVTYDGSGPAGHNPDPERRPRNIIMMDQDIVKGLGLRGPDIQASPALHGEGVVGYFEIATIRNIRAFDSVRRKRTSVNETEIVDSEEFSARAGKDGTATQFSIHSGLGPEQTRIPGMVSGVTVGVTSRAAQRNRQGKGFGGPNRAALEDEYVSNLMRVCALEARHGGAALPWRSFRDTGACIIAAVKVDVIGARLTSRGQQYQKGKKFNLFSPHWDSLSEIGNWNGQAGNRL